MFHYGGKLSHDTQPESPLSYAASSGLAAGLGMGAASEAFRRVSFGSGNQDGSSSSLLMSEGNVRRLVDKLSRMRGAALKLGQFMSIQGTKCQDRFVPDVTDYRYL